MAQPPSAKLVSCNIALQEQSSQQANLYGVENFKLENVESSQHVHLRAGIHNRGAVPDVMWKAIGNSSFKSLIEALSSSSSSINFTSLLPRLVFDWYAFWEILFF
ncbi:hypothetical protein S245_062897 [Arachis hypogaea]